MNKRWLSRRILVGLAAVVGVCGLQSEAADWRFEHVVLPDYFTAEMHMSGYIKQEPPHKVAVFENVDIRKNIWKEHVIAETGTHNARVGDLNGDGYPDIAGSNWNNRVAGCPLKAEVWMNRGPVPQQ